VFATRIGLDDVAVAASSQKAALAALGVHANLFAQGAAAITHDADLVARALANPGEPIRRRIKFSEENFTRKSARAAKHAPAQERSDPQTENRARAAMREAERARAKAAAEEEDRRRREAIADARAALKAFEKESRAELSALEDERHALELRETRAKTGLAARRKRLEDALKRAMEA
jgi:hypothetical protein